MTQLELNFARPLTGAKIRKVAPDESRSRSRTTRCVESSCRLPYLYSLILESRRLEARNDFSRKAWNATFIHKSGNERRERKKRKKGSRDGNKKGGRIMDGKTRYRVSSRCKVCCRIVWFRGPTANDRRREIPLGKSHDAIWHVRS